MPSAHTPATQSTAALQSESSPHSGSGQSSGVSGVQSGRAHRPPRQLVASGSPSAAGQVTASQSREITTVTAASPERVRITRWVATSPPSASRSST